MPLYKHLCVVLGPVLSLFVLLKTRSISKTFLSLFFEMIIRSYLLVVVWNPSLHRLITGSDSLSSAGRTCAPHAHDQSALSLSPGTAVDAGDYYEEYHSHPVPLLMQVKQTLQSQGCQRFIYLAGDSSLDNKHWFFVPFKEKRLQLNDEKFTAPACNGYENALTPPRMVKDVSYWLNAESEKRFGRLQLCTVMSAIEESTVEDRVNHLLAQDVFIRDNITEEDYLILSVGGNDVALRPTLRTAVNMAMLTRSPEALIKNGMAPGFGYFFKFFHDRIEDLLRQLVAKRKPKAILVCMIYYPCEHPGNGWADFTLKALGYNDNPEKLQLIIRTLFEKIAAKGFDIPGVNHVVPFPLFNVLDAKDPADFLQRVEPSVQGGQKMARAFLDALSKTTPNNSAKL